MIKDIIKDGLCELFTPEEWDLWTKGEFNLFDNYCLVCNLRPLFLTDFNINFSRCSHH